MQMQEPFLDSPLPGTGLLQPGRNCWRIERAARFAMLVDADAYFRAVRTAIVNARHSVFILSWDIDSRVRLVPEGANDGYPEALGDFLHEIASSRSDLRVYVLNWDFAMLYALEREWLPVYKLGWRTHKRLEFRMDARHPIGGSHHQKIVVVDDSVAFVGGLDLTRCRWDTPEHACHAPLRRDSDGKPHAPFHDVQALVDGAAARALGEIARARWQAATGENAVPLREAAVEPAYESVKISGGNSGNEGGDKRGHHSGHNGDHDPWPQHTTPDLTDIDVAISRTEPAYEGRQGVHEVRQLHLDAIAAARRHLFFENQYFTSGLIADALAARLAEPAGPEVAIISPQTQSGWLEQATMGVLRARVHRSLKQADRHDRYRMYCPYIPGLGEKCLNVHSKVFAVDDELFSVGSANLSSRSMALDTECNLTIEARGDEPQKQRVRQAIAKLRARLLAEHLDTSPEAVQEETARRGSLLASIAALQNGGRSLREMEPETTPELDALIPEQAIFDPERPIEPEELMAEFVPREAHKPLPGRMIALGLFAVALALLALAWRWTPLRDWVNLESMVRYAEHLDQLPFSSVAIVASYVVAGVLMVPVTLLIAVTGMVFGPVQGVLYALAGTLASAVTTYGIGHWLGHDTVHRLLGQRVNRLSQRIAARGIVAMTVIRVLPVAPFTVVNVIAGASHIRFRDFVIGTFLGMLPGIAMTVTFVHHLAEAVRHPNAFTVAVLAAVAALIMAVALGLRRLLRRREAGQA